MINEQSILNISNIYNLKSIFCYIDYPSILKLVKYNKELQNRLGIEIENYNNRANYPKYNLIKKKVENKSTIPYEFNGEAILGYFGILCCSTCIYFIYVLIYAILLVAQDTFTANNIKENSEVSVSTIKSINLCLFILLVSIIIGVFLFFYYLCKDNDDTYNYGLKRKIKIILIITFNLVLIIFECLIIWKLVLSYDINNGPTTWFIRMDYAFIILNFLYFLLISCVSYSYYKYYLKCFYSYMSYFLDSLNDIAIEKYNVSEDFIKMNEKERKTFILNNFKNMKYKKTLDQKYLIKIINEFRENNKLPKLSVDQYNYIPELIMKEPVEIILNKEQNIFKISNKEYIFKYPINEFEKKFKNKDINIINILLNDKLNHIKVITKNNYEYVLLYQLSFMELNKEEFLL